jgi:hypothetical protein
MTLSLEDDTSMPIPAEILSRAVDKVVCRWCDRSDAVVEPQPDR